MSITIPAVDLAPRVHSRDVADHSIPTGREEEWRFTPLSRLRGLHDGSAELDAPPAIEVTATGFAVETVAMSDPRVGSSLTPSDVIAARAMTVADEATVVSLPSEGSGHADVMIEGRGAGAAHLVIDFGPFSSGTVLVRHRGSATLAESVEVRVADSAVGTVVFWQDWDRDAVHAATHHARLGRDARLMMGHISLGGDLVRILPQVSYSGTGGDAELLGLTFADAGQHLESRVFVDHDTPNCRSSVLYKSALQGDDAHTVWVGDVLVRAEATGIDTYEVNRNLLLTDGARADSVPNLELETGEIVGAGHASATGRFDDEQLFYLQARGIPAELARVLVVRGFFTDVLGRLGLPQITDEVMSTVDSRLGIDRAATGLIEEESE
jgi:Fe-S cluster assembly protein SufD